jgi:regulator of replication initiation timing
LSEYSKKVADEGKQAANEIKQGRKELKRLKAEAERMAEEAVEKQREENDLARRIDEEMAGVALAFPTFERPTPWSHVAHS